jgi:hypothetical protein
VVEARDRIGATDRSPGRTDDEERSASAPDVSVVAKAMTNSRADRNPNPIGRALIAAASSW